MCLARECPEVLHIARDDNEVVFISVGEDIRFIVSTLSDRIPNVNSEQVTFCEIGCDLRVDIFIKKKPSLGHLRPRPG